MKDEADRGVETELKFAIDAADLPALRAHRMFAGLADKRQLLEATYFDTPDNLLHEAGFSLRLRRSGDTVVQTLKGKRPGGSGLLHRDEHERVVADGMLDEPALAEGLPPDLLHRVRGRLEPRFSMVVTRSAWTIEEGDGVVEVSTDEGRIIAGERSEPIAEVEFELLSGDPAALFALARSALIAIPLHLQPLAKSDRGYRLCGGKADSFTGTVLPLDPQATAAAALRSLAEPLVRAIAVERATVMTDSDAEAVHRLRVLLRKQRTLFDLADAMLPGTLPPVLAATIREAFKRLGEARDLDILQAVIPVNQMEAADQLSTIARARNAALLRARTVLASRAFAEALLDLLAFAEGIGHLATDSAADVPAVTAAASALDERWRSIRDSRRPGRLRPAARHKLRIRAKWLRDATEFLAGLFADAKSEKRAGDLMNDLRDLQGALGALNDRDSAWRLGKVWLGKPLSASLGLKPDSRAEKGGVHDADAAFRSLRKCRRYWRGAAPSAQ
ncbi:CHAD domain-containing protein [Kaistia geumhonensis]|uniref:Inorganic triphosphatase YgiF n=1 Tax=Kaistia geumhonensis TaxID=410839 RepID=A0ABU0M238_9HYPH|nr:CYTH and CHAD domain-containing protein [Kaistia geumhonensis]MCX5479755.1 CHAD domain-containing protein [Kaistia geumhonensis]MDQ0515020.1 inorganic triphosphatase YgiF [Kaistia geumhonensis]